MAESTFRWSALRCGSGQVGSSGGRGGSRWLDRIQDKR